jgi:hypothetical protein
LLHLLPLHLPTGTNSLLPKLTFNAENSFQARRKNTLISNLI